VLLVQALGKKAGIWCGRVFFYSFLKLPFLYFFMFFHMFLFLTFAFLNGVRVNVEREKNLKTNIF